MEKQPSTAELARRECCNCVAGKCILQAAARSPPARTAYSWTPPSCPPRSESPTPSGRLCDPRNQSTVERATMKIARCRLDNTPIVDRFPEPCPLGVLESYVEIDKMRGRTLRDMMDLPRQTKAGYCSSCISELATNH